MCWSMCLIGDCLPVLNYSIWLCEELRCLLNSALNWRLFSSTQSFQIVRSRFARITKAECSWNLNSSIEIVRVKFMLNTPLNEEHNNYVQLGLCQMVWCQSKLIFLSQRGSYMRQDNGNKYRLKLRIFVRLSLQMLFRISYSNKWKQFLMLLEAVT